MDNQSSKLTSTDIVKCASCNVVINEVLAFICNKIDVMDEQSISRICVSAFSESDIMNAKNLLFTFITTSKRKKTRKNQGKTLRDIEDIVSLLKETDPEEIPIFVARDLQKLPPVLFDHVDVTRLLKDIVKMRSDMDRICEEYATVKQLRDLSMEVESLRNASIVNNFQQNINTRRGAAALLSNFEYESGPMGLSPMCNEPTTRSKKNTICSANKQNTFSDEGSSKTPPRRESNGSCVVIPQRTADSALPTDASSTNRLPAAAATEPVINAPIHTAGKSDTQTNLNSRKSFSEIVSESESRSKSQPLDDGFILVQKRKLRNRFIGQSGKAIVDNDSTFKAACIKVPIYIYNVSKETTVGDIKKFISCKTNVDITLEKMNMKTTKEYNAFKIFVPKYKVGEF